MLCFMHCIYFGINNSVFHIIFLSLCDYLREGDYIKMYRWSCAVCVTKS